MLLDDRRGSVGQAKGIAEALGNRIDIVEKNIVYNSFAVLPNWVKGRTTLGLNKSKSDNLSAPYPDFVLSTSRRTVSVARNIRKNSGYKTKIIQLMYPSEGVGICDMEMVVVPAHDSAKKQQIKNAFVITGAPTRIFKDKIPQIRADWEKTFEHLPKPWISVIVGGAIKGKPWPLENAKALAAKLKEIQQKTKGSILITSSRRTGAEAEKIIMQSLEGVPTYTYMWGEKKENPIMGFYTCADIIVATADSVSMCSEACGTGACVLLFKGENWLTKKHLRFADSLIKAGFAQDINAENALEFKPKATLNPSVEIAEKILELI